ncbi:MAG: SUMF1/EgtB/PvdO family nonheme iron enzyme [Microcystis sp. M114S2]|jgi:formylglycine-generating enzyme required for sulfatase activity/energy-coupling factor transporter ATP-binding protein EcfA2|uniref:nSTAND1 domain-containing NTPase n=1 Tax=unclassified Microcystis TaxID=2643300 RepID=UPI002587F11F|nr:MULTISPECIES: SUMF1/EgtB/PvdO family nonheme iron enzyme [unclassified Microcystis]MCA2668608.1 SUMF1/EgtB/PvdO family nonheme iron enzyme [Microcystis sp. M045S2]MCA2713379.1 SUMF1/EgtB/PvdO family nonheme iron enzyme [Microcystis sp. M172S2]MCA2804419.1 SUMF1/EgtB/PvdO family nonheme iron enzyme [Microcystis sp. M114S2]MCA2832273.1 SUMF1/EgtB/PvdO family nonheme iron enzyme [Microcystis sp. M007S1]MCA2837414.1 SUMF1/EgtB/PvdO family nonheme iron enzyme [Microcystis sp. M078S1]
MARYALIIGINDYDFLPSLSKPAKDAEAVAQFLENTRTFENVERLPKRWIPAEERYEVVPGKVTKDKVLEALKEILSGEQTENQEVLIYFSGHGFCLTNDIGDRETYLATSDSQRDGQKAISLERGLNRLLHRSNLSNLVVMLDCCHAGALLPENPELNRTLLEPSLSAFKEKQDYYLIAACRSQQVAWEDEEYSLFTAALLKGLSQKQADPETGEISADRLFDFVSRELRGKGQEPIRMGVGRSLILVKYGAQPQVKKVKPLLDEKGELRCPYQGLLAFTKKERPFFFGRKRVVDDIKSKLDRLNFVPLIGASGSGKSSVVLAGLMPWLEELGWQILEPIKPGFKPLTMLESLLLPYFRDDQQLLDECINNPASEGLKPLLELFPCEHKEHKFLLVVDQFEELFTFALAEQRDRFIELITQVATIPDFPLAVVATMRADFIEPCLRYDGLRQIIQNNAEYLSTLRGSYLREAITEPAKLQGYDVTIELCDKILEDIDEKEQGFLPLLEFALTQLWQKRDEAEHRLTLDTYEAIGGIVGALNCQADKVYQYKDYEKDSPQQERTETEKTLIKRIFLNLLQIGDGEKDTRLRQPKAFILSLAGDNQEGQKVLTELIEGEQGLVKGRLLVTGKTEREEEAWVDLAHEALIEKWDNLNLWRTETRKGRELAKQVDKDAKDWQKNNRSQYYLWSGDKLADAEKILQEYQDTVETTQLAKNFLEASSQQELYNYLRSSDIDNLERETLEKEAANKSFLNREKLRNLLENEKEKAQIRLSASWLLKQWGEEVPIWTAEVDKQGNIALSIIAENKLPATVIEELESGINLEMLEIPGGEFWMGSPEREDGSYPDERPPHRVTISPFLMGKYPITQAQWRAVASLPKIERDLNPDPSTYKGDSRRPVESISWYEAVEFCERLSLWSQEKGKGYQYRLPSEAEWEYACRAVISYQSSVISEESIQNPIYPPYHFGCNIDPALANYGQTARARTTAVGRFQIVNAFGLYDMHGNVWEWCLDPWHDNYKDAPNDGRAWKEELCPDVLLKRKYVVRGGSWGDGPRSCRSAYRGDCDYLSDFDGFRVVASSRTVIQ